MAASSRQATPLPQTWSNPTGQPLAEVVGGKVWAAERPIYPPLLLGAVDVGARAGVVRLADGGLWVHSPVPLDGVLRPAVDALGPVRHVVSPNYEHTMYAQEWIEAYPECVAYACPGLMQKQQATRYAREVGAGGAAPPPEWGGEFDLLWLDYEQNPFNRKPFFNEVVFCHKPSRVLFVADLFWNYPSDNTPLPTRAWKFGMDVVYKPFYKSVMISERRRFREQLDRILSWEWDCIVPCHGDVVPRGGKEALARFLM